MAVRHPPMRDDYPLSPPLKKVTVTIEKVVVSAVVSMEQFKGCSVSEITITALKRFISHHKDFLPPQYNEPKSPESQGSQVKRGVSTSECCQSC